MNNNKHVFFKMYILHFISQMARNEIYKWGGGTSHSTFFMLYSSFQCYIVIQSFHPLHHTVDVHSQQNTRNCRLSWKCNFDLISKHRLFYVTKHILSSQIQRILYSHREYSPSLIMDKFFILLKAYFSWNIILKLINLLDMKIVGFSWILLNSHYNINC